MHWCLCTIIVYRLANQRILAVEAQLEDLQEAARHRGNTEDNSEILKKMNEQIQKNKSLDDELQKKRSHIDEIEARLTTAIDRINTQQDELNRKDEDMVAMENRYRKYLEKAKNVSQILIINGDI